MNTNRRAAWAVLSPWPEFNASIQIESCMPRGFPVRRRKAQRVAASPPLVATSRLTQRYFACLHVAQTRLAHTFADPFKLVGGDEMDEELGGGFQSNLVHIRLQQRTGRKTLTTVQGLADVYDKKKVWAMRQKDCAGSRESHG